MIKDRSRESKAGGLLGRKTVKVWKFLQKLERRLTKKEAK